MQGVGYQLSRAGAQRLFFDRAAVRRAIDPKTRRFLTRAGGYTRKTSRSMLKKPRRQKLKEMTPAERRQFRIQQAIAKREGRPAPQKPRVNQVSQPGSPPVDQTGALKGSIFFSADLQKKSVVIGPVAFAKGTDAAEALEHGGYAQVAVQSTHGKKRRRMYVRRRPLMQPAMAKAMTPGKVREFWGGSV